MDAGKVKSIAEKALEGSDAYIVDCTVAPSNLIEIVIDSDSKVTVDQCADLNRTISEALNRDIEDFELTVASAGIGEPLRLLRQYRRLIGSPVEIVLCSGEKIIGHLEEADEKGIKVSYDEKVAVEGKKRKELQHVVRTLTFPEMKCAKEYLDFK